MTELLDALRQAATPPPPKGWEPGIRFAGSTPSEIVTPWLENEVAPDEYDNLIRAMGWPLPEGHTLVLVEARYNQAAWQRKPEDSGIKHSAFTGPAWCYKFAVRPISQTPLRDADIADLMKQAKKAAPHRPVKRADGGTMVVNLSDPQVGKVDERGGTEELLVRAEAALNDVKARIRLLKPARVILADGGDSTEGFNSAPNAARVNDLQEIEAHRVWRRLFWRWITELAKLTDDLTVLSVPSNHCRNRAGRNALGPISDDWGLDALSIMADMAAVNPEAYGHIKFLVPREHEEHVTLTLEGKVVSFIHGHQANSPKKATEWVKKMGRHDVGVSDVVVMSHFHRLSLETFGDDQTLVICSALDGGSSWYSVQSGERARAGVTTFVIDGQRTLRDLHVAY